MRNVWFPLGGPLKPSLYLAWLLRYHVSNTQPSIFPLKMHWYPFLCFMGKIWVTTFCTFLHSHCLGTSFELSTATISPGPRYYSVRTFSLKMHYRGEKLQKRRKGHRILTLTKALLLFSQPLCKISSKSNKNCDLIAWTDRQTEGRQWFYNLSRATL